KPPEQVKNDPAKDGNPPKDKTSDKKPEEKRPKEETRPKEVKRLAPTGKDIYQHVLKSTAWILTKMRQATAMGTGTLIDKKNRLVLTNYHVVHGQLDMVVFFPVYKNGKLVSERSVYLEQVKNRAIDVVHAKVIDQDTRRDLALIQVDKI